MVMFWNHGSITVRRSSTSKPDITGMLISHRTRYG
jgi:hypothetical protein